MFSLISDLSLTSVRPRLSVPSPSEKNNIRRLFPAARFVWIPDAGHWVHSEKPSEFLDVVCPFLAA